MKAIVTRKLGSDFVASSGRRFSSASSHRARVLRAAGLATRRGSTKRRKCRCGRIDRCTRAQRYRRRRSFRHSDDGPRVGRHQGTEYAAAALVDYTFLRLHRLGVRLLDGLSGMAVVSGYTAGVLHYSSRAAVAVDLADLEKLRGEQMIRRSPRLAQRYREGPGAAGAGAGAGQGRVRRQLRAVPRQRRGRRQGLSRT